MVPGLGGDGVSDGESGSAEGHHGDPESPLAPVLHRSTLQSVLAGNHAHRQSEKVRQPSNTQAWDTAFRTQPVKEQVICDPGEQNQS